MTVRRADCVQIESTPETRSFVEVTTTTDAINARQIAAGPFHSHWPTNDFILAGINFS